MTRNKPMNRLSALNPKRWIALCAVVCAMSITLFSQPQRPDRIAAEVTTGEVVTLPGSVHPLTRRATDLGSVTSDMQMEMMSLNIGLSAAQQTEVDALIAAQQNPKSPQYHQWLTQEEYGARFGLTESDLNKITGWLQAQGFSVKRVSTSRNTVYFSGKAWQAESAFHTQLHIYSLNGETHFANATELRIPAALAGVVTRVGGLNSFRPKPHHRASDGKISPDFTSDISGNHFLTPGDWATIYDVTPIYNAGLTGSGMHVAVAGQTYFDQSDIDSFRSAAGLGPTNLKMVCISTTNCTGAPGENLNDIPEADLDVEWSGGIAKNATVDFIYASGSDPSLGVFDAAVYAITTYQVNGKPVPVLSISYAMCEPEIGATTANAEEVYLQQAATQGQTILNSSGDSGAAACDYDASVSTQGAAVNWPTSSPNVTGVGGTEFSGDGSDSGADEFWTYSSTADIISSALQYIPETGWNDTVASGTLSSSGGGVSQVYALPSWQLAPSNYTGTMMRFVPDVSFSASADHDGYLVCSGGNCNNGFRSTNGSLTPYGGTSASTPSFAGLVTLLVQKYGKLGNLNPAIYGLAKNASTYASVFHDVTTGSNKQPCTAGTGCSGGFVGYTATPGYDLVTGLGSIDASVLSAALTPAPEPTTTVVSASPSSVAVGGTTSLVATVTSTTVGTITGTVEFTVTEGSSNTILGVGSLLNGTATLINVSATVADGFLAGAGSITAIYSGDANFAGSSGSTSFSVTPAATATVVTATPNSVVLNGTTTLGATVTPLGGTGTVTFRVGNTTLGTATVSSGIATLGGVAVSAADGFSVGSVTVTAIYSGDANYAASTGTVGLTVKAIPSTATTVTATPSSVTMGGSTTLTASVNSGTAGTITGTVTFTVGSTTLGTVAVSSGTATLNNVAVTAGNGFSVGLNSITAVYGGNANYSSSIGSVSGVSVAAPPAAPSYSLIAASTAVTGSSAVTLTLASTNYAGTVTLATTVTSSNGTASNVTASLSSPSVTLASNGTGTSELTITANSNASNRAPVFPWQSGGAIVFGAIFGVPFAVRRKRMLAVLLVGAAITLAGLAMACGNGGSAASPVKVARIYTVTVTPTATGAVANPAPVSVTVTVQ
jgi:subtilase family serine protease